MSGIKKILILMVCALLGSHVFAQEYPTKPIKIIVGYAPGGAVDLIARSLAKGAGLPSPSPSWSRTRMPRSRGASSSATLATT